MIFHRYTKKIFPQILCIFLALWHHACASDQQGQTQEEGLETNGEAEAADVNDGAEGNDGAEANDFNSFANSDGMENTASPESLEGDAAMNNISNFNDLANGAAEATANQAAANPDALQNPINGTMTATPAEAMATNAVPMQGGDALGRVVRFITSDGTPVYDKPQADGVTVTTMLQGDPLVVTLQGEWAQIVDGRFVMTSALSEAAVPRLKSPAPWMDAQASP